MYVCIGVSEGRQIWELRFKRTSFGGFHAKSYIVLAAHLFLAKCLKTKSVIQHRLKFAEGRQI